MDATRVEPSLAAADPETRNQRVGKAAFAITLLNLSGRVLGFLEGVLVSRYVGSSAAGAYFAASKVPWGIYSFGEQLLTHAFLPPFVEVRERESEKSAWRLASTVATVLSLLLLAVTAAGMLLAPLLVRLYTREFSEGDTRLTVSLIRIMLPAVLMMSLSSLTYVLLNAYKQFALPALGDVALKAGIVVSGALCWRVAGIKAFAAGLLLGSLFKLATHALGLRRRLSMARPSLDVHHPAFRKLILLMLPLMFGNLLSMIRPLLDTKFCGPTREIAALNFAFKLTNLPFTLVPYALGIALFPFLAEMATRGDRQQISRALVSALRMTTYLLLPITIAYLILARPLVDTVYGGGKFTAEDSARVVSPLIWYTLGMIPIAIETILLQIFFALSDTFFPTLIAYGAFVVYLLAAAFGTTLIGWGAAGVALAVTLSKAVKDACLLGLLLRRIEKLDLRGVGTYAYKLALAALVLASMLWATLRFGYHTAVPRLQPAAVTPPTAQAGVKSHGKKPGAAGKLKVVKMFVVCAAPGSIAFLLISYWLGIPEFFVLYGVAERRLRPLCLKAATAASAPW